MIKLANAPGVFAKRIFEQHVINCDITRTEFSLVGAALSCNYCDVCALLNRVIQYFKDNVDLDHHQLPKDCKTKIFLYQGHRVSVVNQRKVINEYLRYLADDQAYLKMDFKIIFEAMYYK